MKQTISIILCLLLLSCDKSPRAYFKDFIGFEPTDDVRHLHSYSDELGIDASSWLAFECDDTTIDRIVSQLRLTEEAKEARGLYGGLNSRPSSWWDTSFVLHARPFHKQESRVHWYLWYDKEAHKAYFLTFDL